MNTKVICTMFVGLMLSVAGCASVRPGDGKLGNIPLDPAVSAASTYIDKYVPGGGAKLTAYFSQTKVARIPAGYDVKWNVRDKKTGVETPEEQSKTQFERVPRLEVSNPSVDPSISVDNAVKSDVSISDVTSALTPEQMAELVKILGGLK